MGTVTAFTGPRAMPPPPARARWHVARWTLLLAVAALALALAAGAWTRGQVAPLAPVPCAVRDGAPPCAVRLAGGGEVQVWKAGNWVYAATTTATGGK